MKNLIATGAFVLALGFGMTSMPGNAAEPKDNRLWGEFASATAHLPGIDGKGGGMGAHSRSTTAADNVGGFANSENIFTITFNEENADGNHARNGAANQTRVLGFEPKSGGMGQHAVANCQAANNIDPVTGESSGGENAFGACPALP